MLAETHSRFRNCRFAPGIARAYFNPPPAPEVAQIVKALQLGDSKGFSERSFPGRAEAAQEAALSFRVSGQVEELRVNVGDTVAKGDILAVLGETDFTSDMATMSKLRSSNALCIRVKKKHTV